jgi:hypothetical protein
MQFGLDLLAVFGPSIHAFRGAAMSFVVWSRIKANNILRESDAFVTSAVMREASDAVEYAMLLGSHGLDVLVQDNGTGEIYPIYVPDLHLAYGV